MTNLCLITSVINPSKNPLSYISTRSIFDTNQRFEQTMNTIKSLRHMIPDLKIFLIETSNLSDQQELLLKNQVDYYLNLINDKNIVERTSSISKSMGEGTQTIKALEFLIDSKLEFNNFFKISGRYWLNDKFDFNNFKDEKIIFKKINEGNYNTCFYKIPKRYINKFYYDLIKSENSFQNCEGYEVIFSRILDKYEEKQKIETIGIEGYVSVSGEFYQG